MKNLGNFAVAILLVGVMFILGSVMKEVAESGPTIHKVVQSFVSNSNNDGAM